MTEHEMEQIAEMVAQKVADRTPPCSVFDEHEVQAMKKFVANMDATTTAAIRTLVAAIILTVLGFIAGGIAQRLK